MALDQWDNPNDLWDVASLVREFDNSEDPQLMLHVAEVLFEGGYMSTAKEVLEELEKDGWVPAIWLLGHMHLRGDFEDSNDSIGYKLLDRATAQGSLRAPLARALYRREAAPWYLKPYWQAMASFAAMHLEYALTFGKRDDETVW